MSGGVDSSVTAKLLCDAENECIGCTMKLYRNEDAGISAGHTCCSLDDVEDARRVAYHLGMAYYVFNFAKDFAARVIDPFVAAYRAGRTPNPCIECNRHMKFDKLYTRAKMLGCDYIATGHYARIVYENGSYRLKKALDPTKDQSYVLYGMTKEQLAHTLFPLGALSKQTTRSIAAEGGLCCAEKPDSQDICFVPDGDYARVIESRVIESRTGEAAVPGILSIRRAEKSAHIAGSSTTRSGNGVVLAYRQPIDYTFVGLIRHTIPLHSDRNRHSTRILPWWKPVTGSMGKCRRSLSAAL